MINFLKVNKKDFLEVVNIMIILKNKMYKSMILLEKFHLMSKNTMREKSFMIWWKIIKKENIMMKISINIPKEDKLTSLVILEIKMRMKDLIQIEMLLMTMYIQMV